MKPIYWVLLIISAVIFPLVFMIIVPIVLLHKSWWWFFGTLIFELVVGAITGIIYFIISLNKKPKQEEKTGIDEAEIMAINKLKYDKHIPDNFIRKQRTLSSEGDQGKERTPILWLSGHGTESLLRYDLLINLNKAKDDPLIYTEKTDEEMLKFIERFAENPANEEVEERVAGMDSFGRPTTIIKSKKMSITQKKEEDKVEQAKQQEAF